MSKLLRYVGLHDEVYLPTLGDLVVTREGLPVEVPDEIAGHGPTDDAASITARDSLTPDELNSAMRWGRGLLAQPTNWQLIGDGESTQEADEKPAEDEKPDQTEAPDGAVSTVGDDEENHA